MGTDVRASLTVTVAAVRMSGVTTPFDDPQAELAWMFLQCLSEDGDLDECFELLSDDFTYWSILTRESVDKAALRAGVRAAQTPCRVEPAT